MGASRRVEGGADPVGLVVAGFDGPELSPEAEALICEGVAGFTLFSRNLTDRGQTAELTARMQATAARAGHPPLLIAADQEGGRVRRLRRGLTPFPSAMALCAAGLPDQVYWLCRTVATELLSVGVNVNYAPCADVNTEPRNPVIGTRSFGDDPSDVASMVVAAVRGYQDGGVLACAKHFPGHGHTKLDSHLTLPVIHRSLEDLRRIDLVPFGAAVSAGVAAVMSAHIVLPQVSGALPATINRAVLTGLLRDELGHEGLILTDCMEMAAMRRGACDAGQTSVRAVAAGADLVLWSHTPGLQAEAIAGLRRAARREELPVEVIDDRLERVRRARLAAAPVMPEDTGQGVWEQALLLWLSAVTLVRGAGAHVSGLPPPLDRQQRVSIVDLTGLSGTAGEALPVHSLATELASRGYQVKLTGPDRPGAQDSLLCLIHDACLKPDQAGMYARLRSEYPHMISIATGLPYDLAWLTRSHSGVGLCTYDPGPGAMWALAEVLSGASTPRGRLPVKLDASHGPTKE